MNPAIALVLGAVLGALAAVTVCRWHYGGISEDADDLRAELEIVDGAFASKATSLEWTRLRLDSTLAQCKQLSKDKAWLNCEVTRLNDQLAQRSIGEQIREAHQIEQAAVLARLDLIGDPTTYPEPIDQGELA